MTIFICFMLFFNTFLTALPIVIYNEKYILGLRLGTIPVEDFFYGIDLVIFVLNAEALRSQFKKAWRSFLISSRPFSWINTGFAALLGILIQQQKIQLMDTLILSYFLLPYNLTLYGVNDVFDYATDRLNPRKKSIEGGLLQPKYHKFLCWLVLSINLFFIPFFFARSVIVGTIFLFTLVVALIYSVPPFRLKSVPLLDSITSALHFVLPIILGILWAGGVNIPWELGGFLLWNMASHMLGALPDIEADKKAGETTIATAFGYRKTALLSAFLYTLALLIFIFSARIPIFLSLLIVPYLINSFRASFHHQSKKAHSNFRFFMFYNLLCGFVISLYLLWSLLL